jgi:drug/metabolite transporter (DMT)-like permease
MSWQILIGISVVTFSFSTIIQRIILKKAAVSPIIFTIVFQVIVGLLILVFGIVSAAEMDIKPNLGGLALNLALSPLLYSVANVLLAKSLAKTEASKFTIIFSTRVIFTIAVAAMFLNEPLTTRQLLGTLLVLGSIILVNLKGRKLSFEKSDLMALLSAVAFGLGNVNDRYILRFANIYPYLVFDFIAPSLILTLFYFRHLPQVKVFLEVKLASRFLLLCSIYAVSATTFLSALKYGENVSQISVVNLTSVIITVFLALILLKETANWTRKSAGAVLCFIGLVLVI